MSARLEPITGRQLQLHWQGRACRVYFDEAGQGIQYRNFGGHLRSTDNRHEGACRLVQRFAQRREFSGKQWARAGNRRMLRNSVSTGLGAMSCTESIHDKDITQRCHFLRQLGIIFLLANVEADVLTHHDFARLYLDAIQPVFCQRNVLEAHGAAA